MGPARIGEERPEEMSGRQESRLERFHRRQRRGDGHRRIRRSLLPRLQQLDARDPLNRGERGYDPRPIGARKIARGDGYDAVLHLQGPWADIELPLQDGSDIAGGIRVVAAEGDARREAQPTSVRADTIGCISWRTPSQLRLLSWCAVMWASGAPIIDRGGLHAARREGRGRDGRRQRNRPRHRAGDGARGRRHRHPRHPGAERGEGRRRGEGAGPQGARHEDRRHQLRRREDHDRPDTRDVRQDRHSREQRGRGRGPGHAVHQQHRGGLGPYLRGQHEVRLPHVQGDRIPLSSSGRPGASSTSPRSPDRSRRRRCRPTAWPRWA